MNGWHPGVCRSLGGVAADGDTPGNTSQKKVDEGHRNEWTKLRTIAPMLTLLSPVYTLSMSENHNHDRIPRDG